MANKLWIINISDQRKNNLSSWLRWLGISVHVVSAACHCFNPRLTQLITQVANPTVSARVIESIHNQVCFCDWFVQRWARLFRSSCSVSERSLTSTGCPIRRSTTRTFRTVLRSSRASFRTSEACQWECTVALYALSTSSLLIMLSYLLDPAVHCLSIGRLSQCSFYTALSTHYVSDYTSVEFQLPINFCSGTNPLWIFLK